MEKSPLVSIVMAAYNAEQHIAGAIRSVLAQTYPHWELLIVDDGSTDGTRRLAASFSDRRIRLLSLAGNQGIGHARNTALDQVKGTLLAFLDADDLLPERSLQARVERLDQLPGVHAVDGGLCEMDTALKKTLRLYRPSFKGPPFRELARLSEACFAGITWMVRWPVDPPLRFQTGSTQMEDLMFFMEYSQPGRLYDHVEEVIYIYRRSSGSITADLPAMERSYRHVHRWLLDKGWLTRPDLHAYRWRARRVMFASWLHKHRPLLACRSLVLPFR